MEFINSEYQLALQMESPITFLKLINIHHLHYYAIQIFFQVNYFLNKYFLNFKEQLILLKKCHMTLFEFISKNHLILLAHHFIKIQQFQPFLIPFGNRLLVFLDCLLGLESINHHQFFNIHPTYLL